MVVISSKRDKKTRRRNNLVMGKLKPWWYSSWPPTPVTNIKLKRKRRSASKVAKLSRKKNR